MIYRNRTHARRGFTIVELIVSTVVLGIVFTAAIPTLAWAFRERRETHRQHDAIQEVHNVLERVTARAWEEIDDEQLAPIENSARLTDRFPQAAWEITSTVDPQNPVAKRIFVRLSWTPGPGQKPASVAATTWVYPSEAQP